MGPRPSASATVSFLAVSFFVPREASFSRKESSQETRALISRGSLQFSSNVLYSHPACMQLHSENMMHVVAPLQFSATGTASLKPRPDAYDDCIPLECISAHPRVFAVLVACHKHTVVVANQFSPQDCAKRILEPNFCSQIATYSSVVYIQPGTAFGRFAVRGIGYRLPPHRSLATSNTKRLQGVLCYSL